MIDPVGTNPLKRSRGRLETQIVGAALLSIIVALLGAFSIYQWRNWRVDRLALAHGTLILADVLARSAHEASTGDDNAALVSIRELVAMSDREVSVIYWPVRGREVSYSSPGATLVAPPPKPVKAPEYQYRGAQLEVFAPVMVGGERVGSISLLVDGYDLVVARIVNIAIAVSLSVMALMGAGLMARRMTRKALESLYGLVEAIDSAATHKDFSARMPVSRDDELGLLTERFNHLLATLEVYEGELQAALSEATAARDSAENANRLKERFLANMSHELRTPLNGVLGMSQSLLREPMVPSQRERAELIMSSGSVLLMLLNEILDLSDLERGAIRLESKPFDLATTIGEACDAAILMAEDKGVALQIEVDADAAGRWLGDARRLHQILYHLVANALKFTAAGQVRVIASAKAGDLILSVADTGMGIDAEALPRLFEAFTQVDDASTRAFGGAGIGLSVCHRLVGLMGGRLEVESQVGQGSLFTVVLPMGRDRATEPAAGQDAGLRVLVAEDNEANQRVVRTVLNALGIDPVIVADGEAVVRAWSTGAWDLVLMDIQMPLKNGVDATLEIRRLEAERGLPTTRIVALTANAMPHQIETYSAAGMNGVVQKPIMITDLQAALTGDRAA